MSGEKKSDNTKRAPKSVSSKLLIVQIPMIAVSIILIMFIVFAQASSIITELATGNLQREADYYAQRIGREVSAIMSYFDSAVDSVENIPMESDAEVAKYLAPTLSYSTNTPNGVYIGLSNRDFIDPSGWVPDDDYDATTRDWYTDGLSSSTFVHGEPYVDSDTGSMVVSFSRKVTMPDGRSGVAATDYTLDGIVAEINGLKPLKTGGALLLSDDVVLSYFKSEFNGSKVSEHAEDTFLTAVSSYIKSGKTDVTEITSYNGTTYYVSISGIPGTQWTLACSVAKDEVLSGLRQFQIISIILMLVLIAIISVVIYLLLSRMVTKPVGALTENISKITDGDFTVDISTGGNDEIGFMNNNMKNFVTTMRGTLDQIKSESEKLAKEAENSKDASGKLNIQATEQSNSMEQIKETMDGMASAVAELAENATELAGEVSELMDQGKSAGDTVSALVEKAKNGQRDMELVKSGMESVAGAMTEMNSDVQAVGESAEKINSIIEMINSIAEQTNLLSLNASIEAARAGEVGKGFAVVATEIGQLANNSADSTTQIAEIIKDITAQIERLSEKSENNMKEIQKSSEAVIAAGESFQEIFENLDITSNTVHDMVEKISNVDTIATSVAAISEEQSASTEEVSATADNLAVSARQVADESQGVDDSASTVSKSAENIEDYVKNSNI